MDNLATFKMQIESMFDKSFQELNQRNNLNKAILNNLMEAANDQTQKINQLDQNIEALKRTSTPNIATIRNQINSQEKVVHEGFDSMMHRLCQIQQGVNQAKKNAQTNMQINRQSEQSLNQLLREMEILQKEEAVPEYQGNRDQLYREVAQFQKILDQQNSRFKTTVQSLEAGKKTSNEPLQTFETKLAMHNKNNEELLKSKLRNFSDKIKKVEKKLEEAIWTMNNQTSKAKNEQNKMLEDIQNVQKQMGKVRQQLELVDERRKQDIQKSAITLDSMVEQMLAETKKLQLRVQNLKRGYEEQNAKMRNR